MNKINLFFLVGTLPLFIMSCAGKKESSMESPKNKEALIETKGPSITSPETRNMNNANSSIFQFEMDDIQGTKVPLETYKGKVVLIVNVASECGLTPQYKDLQAMYTQYKERGFTILGFPANNFAGQEPGSNKEILGFCTSNYGVDFPMFAKLSVKGKDQHPLYQFLTQKEKNGLLDSEVKWNFQKFLIDKEGKLIKVIKPTMAVTDPEVVKAVEDLLK